MAMPAKKSEAPWESAEGTPSKNVNPATYQTTFLRLVFFSSTMNAVGTSSNEIVEVSAAIDSSIKNNAPTNRPPGILANNSGNIAKISVGPWSGACPMANSAGKIINPAKKAIRVSKTAIITPEVTRLSFLDT